MIAQNRTSPKITDLLKRYGETPDKVLARFNPSRQVAFCRDESRAFFGNAPRLRALIAAYGRTTAEMWMLIQLEDLSAFAGCKDKLSVEQLKEMAAMIADTYPRYKLTEFMLFFQRFKRCQYGRFYGAVDPMIIFQALADFDDERRRAYAEEERRQRIAKARINEQEAFALRQRYIDRVPDAFSAAAPISFLQYRLMGFDTMPEAERKRTIDDIRAGRKTLPHDVRQMLHTIQQAYEIND